MSILEFKF